LLDSTREKSLAHERLLVLPMLCPCLLFRYSNCMDMASLQDFFVNNPIFFISIGISAVVATLLYVYSLSDVVQKELKRRRMKHRISALKNHYILCGFGRVGQQVAKELSSEHQAFVIIDREEDKLKLAKENDWPFLVGDVAVDETIFTTAQVTKAKGVIISVGNDADAIFMAISARSLNPDIFLVARASSLEAADKLTKIGVNRVALPYQIGGYHMATMALRPSVVDFLDTLVDDARPELEMEEIFIEPKGHYDGKTIAEADVAKQGMAVLVIRRNDGKAIVNPATTTALKGGDRLVLMGSEADLRAVANAVQKNQPERTTSSVDSQDIKASPFLDEDPN